MVNFDFPFSESIIIYIGLSTIFLGLIMFIITIYQAVHRKFDKKEDKKKKPPPGCLTQLIRILLICLLIAMGFAILFFGAFIQSLNTFTKSELVAEVMCEQINSVENTMRMTLIEKKGRNANLTRQFMLTGDQWFVRGDIIKWDSWLNFIGLHTMYKLNRVGGYFVDPKEEKEQKSTHYSLVPEEESPRWKWLYKNGYKLPFINDVYGNSVYKYPESNKVFKIYVTISGFTIGTEDQETY